MSANRKSLRNRHLRAVCHFVAASCLAVLSGVTACQSIDSLPLGLLLYPHEFEVYDATNDGAVRVGSVDFQLQDAKRAHAETSPNVSASVAARWTPLGGVQMLGFLDDGASGRLQVFSRALAVSDDGSVVIGVSQSKTANSEAFRWTQESGMQTLAALPMGVSNVWPLGISADAQYVVGRATINDTFKGFFWSQASGYVLIDPNDDSITRVEVVGVSDDGQVAAGICNCNGRDRAFQWTGAKGVEFVDTRTSENSNSVVYGISGDGLTIVGQSYNGDTIEAFRWTAETGIVAIDDDGRSGVARAASFDGRVIIGNINSAPNSGPFFWDSAHGLRALRDVVGPGDQNTLDSYTGSVALDVSSDGRRVTGEGRNAIGDYERWFVEVDVNQLPG